MQLKDDRLGRTARRQQPPQQVPSAERRWDICGIDAAECCLHS
jgi:hypothetical protein